MSSRRRGKSYEAKKSKDYSRFVRSEENRIVDIAKRKRLETSMRKHGFIPSLAISVQKIPGSNKFLVREGQHRLAMSEKLGIEFYYIEDDTEFDIASVNAASKVWDMKDYAMRFAASGNEDYAEALEFAERYRVTVGTACMLLAGASGFKAIAESFREGSFKVKEREWAEKVAELHQALYKQSKAARNNACLMACMAVCRVPGFSVARMVRNIKKCPEKIVSYSTRDAFLGMLEEIYNWRVRTTNMVPLKLQAVQALRRLES